MRPLAVLTWLLLPLPALAGWPNDVRVSELRTHDGLRAPAPTTEAWRALVADLGTAVANVPWVPAATTGAVGWDVSLGNTFVFVDAYDDDEPTAWQRSHPEGRPAPYLFLPAMTLRKGLPWSFEVGTTGGWVGGSRQGVLGGFVRYAPFENHKPYPDLAFQVGYSGYIGNDELDLGVLDLGVTVGSTFPLHRIEEGVTYSHWSPFLGVDLLRVSASPRLSDELAADVGAFPLGRGAEETALALVRVSTGFQVTTGRALLRLGASWVPQTAPTLGVGMGFAL